MSHRLALHLALVAGSVLFSLPFLWLISTSFKVADEMFPPRWIPEAPRGVEASPYIDIRPNERPRRPVTVEEDDWARVVPAVRSAIKTRLHALGGDLPPFYRQYFDQPAMTGGILARLTKRAPDGLFSKVDDVAASWFAENVTPALVREVFDTVYRRLALSGITFHGWDVSTESAAQGEAFEWEAVGGDVKAVARTEGLLKPAQELHYSFADHDRFAMQAVVPMDKAMDNLKKIVVSVHGDRSWHELLATVEMDAKRYEAARPAYLGTDIWQEYTWQFASADDDSIKMKSWLRLDEAGSSDFGQPGKVRLTLEVRQAGGIQPVLNKYLNNYREALRMVPLPTYVKNSLILVVLNIIGQIIGSSLVAFAFARLQWPGRDFFFIIVLATLMIPPQVTMIPVFLIFKSLGWYNTLRPLWVASFFGSAFYIFLLRQFMRSIPKDLEDSAKIDGCGYPGIYRHVILPLVKPALAAIGIFTFLQVWNDFMGPLIYLNDQELYPLSLGLFALQVFRQTQVGLMMAAAVIMTLPIIILFFVAQRQFIQGITLTGMKG